MHGTIANSEVCLLFSLSPSQTGSKELTATTLQPTDVNEEGNALFDLPLDRPMCNPDNCPVVPQSDIAVHQQEKKSKTRVSSELIESDQEICVVPLRPNRKRENLTDQNAVALFRKPVPRVVLAQSERKEAICETSLHPDPIHSCSVQSQIISALDNEGQSNTVVSQKTPTEKTTTGPFLPIDLFQNPSLQTDRELVSSKDTEQPSSALDGHNKDSSACIQPFSNTVLFLEATEEKKLPVRPDVLDDEHYPSLSIIKKIHIPKRVKTGRLNNDKDITKTDDSQQVYQLPLAGNKFAPLSNMTIQKAEDLLALKNVEWSEQIKNPVPKPRGRKHISGSIPDKCITAIGASQDSHGKETLTEERSGLLYSLSRAEELPQNEQSKDCLNLSAESSAPSGGRLEQSIYAVCGDSSEKTPGPSCCPIPKERRKRSCGPFLENSKTGSHVDNFPLVTDTKVVKQNQKPVHQAQKHLENTQMPSLYISSLKEIKLPQTRPDETCSKKPKEGSVSLDFCLKSDGGSITVQREEEVLLQLERDVLEAMQEVFTQTQSLEDSEEVQDEISKDWTFTDEPLVTNTLQNEKKVVSETENIQKVLEREINRSTTVTVTSSQDDWLHIEHKTETKFMGISTRRKVTDEELDFVSVDVAAGCSENQR